MDAKTYIFESPTYGWQPELRISVNGHKGQPLRHLCETSYNRFVKLANSGNYIVEIMPHDHGVAWQLRRKTAKSLPKHQRCQFCGERVLPDDIFCAYHRHRENELISTDFEALQAQADYYEELARSRQ